MPAKAVAPQREAQILGGKPRKQGADHALPSSLPLRGLREHNGNGRVVLIVADPSGYRRRLWPHVRFLPAKCPRLDIQPGCGLVQKQDIGAQHQDLRQVEPLGHAARKHVRTRSWADFFQANAREQPVKIPRCQGRGASCPECKVFPRGKTGIEKGGMRQIAHSAKRLTVPASGRQYRPAIMRRSVDFARAICAGNQGNSRKIRGLCRAIQACGHKTSPSRLREIFLLVSLRDSAAGRSRQSPRSGQKDTSASRPARSS